MIIIRLMMIFIIIGIVPILLGNIVTVSIGMEKKVNLLDLYLYGFLTMLAIFQLICIPFTFLYNKFHVVVIAYIIALVILCIYSISLNNKIKINKILNFNDLSKYERGYFVIFMLLLFVQIYYAIFYETSYMSYDDYEYITIANDTISSDRMFATECVTGKPIELTGRRALNSYLIFIAFIAKVTNTHITTIAHTVLPVILIMISYITYNIIAKYIFDIRENRLIFMMLIAVVNIFGLYSLYSLTFRLLGSIWQGKAILMVIVIPLLFVYLPSILTRAYNRKDALALLIISIAGCSLSMMGAGMIPVVVCCYCAIFLFVRKDWNILRYAIIGSTVPILHFAAYLLMG